jgi:hypothetical protein
MLYEDIPDKGLRDHAIGKFLRVEVPALIEGPGPSVQVEPALLVLTEAELEAVEKARTEFLEHDR